MVKRLALSLIACFLLLTAFCQLPNKSIDVEHYRFSISLNDENNTISGEAAITMRIKEEVSQVSLDLVTKNASGKGMQVSSVSQDGTEVGFSQESDHLLIKAAAKANDHLTFVVKYSGEPDDGLIIDRNKFNQRTFFSDNWPNRAHHWIPCNDHPSDKATVEFLITAPDHYQVVCNGLKVEESNLEQHLRLTHWKEEVAISTKIFALGVADFAVNYIGNVGCIPIYDWLYPQDKIQGFKDYALTKNILPWYIEHVGPYAYEKLANIQSKTIFGGVENAGAIFYAEKSVGSPDIESLLAHELAHQWFGDQASETDWPHLWLSEGFATYMTHLYFESKYGTDTLKAGMVKDRKGVIKLSYKKEVPVVDSTGILHPMELLNANSYQKGGWILHMLRRKLGDTTFWQSVRTYYEKYTGGNASTNDLQTIFEATSHQKLDTFFHQWLYTPGQPKLLINWQYDTRKKQLILKIDQQQSKPFSFPLVLKLGDEQVQSFEINQRSQVFTIPMPSKPETIIPDPDVNLLFEYQLAEGKVKK